MPWDVGYFSYNYPSWFLSTLILLYFIQGYLIEFYDNIAKGKYKVIKIMLLCVLIYFMRIIIINNNIYDRQFTKWLFYISLLFRIIDFSISLLVELLIKYLKCKEREENWKMVFAILECISILIFIIIYIDVAYNYIYFSIKYLYNYGMGNK